MLTKTTSVLVSSFSITALTLTFSVSVYLYSCYARPDVIDPDLYKNYINTRLNNIDSVISKLKNWYDERPYFVAPDIKDNKLIELEEKTTREINPVKPDNKNNNIIESDANTIKVEKLPENINALTNIFLGNEEEHRLERIEFHTRSIVLQHELKMDEVLDQNPSNEMIKTQVGLSLGTPEIEASVQKIQNLFGEPGLVGYMYVIRKRSSFNHKGLFQALDFSSKNDLENSLMKYPNTKNFDKETKNFKFECFLVNNYNIADNLIIKAAEQDEMNYSTGLKYFINPYKWLYLATRPQIVNTLNEHNPVIVITYPKIKDNTNNQEELLKISKMTVYPSDINLFPLQMLRHWDINVYEADEQRILNHCKIMLKKDYTDSVDDDLKKKH